MKSTIVILMAILIEACCYGWLLGEENEQLKSENAVLQQKIVMTDVENSRLKWQLQLAKAGVPQDEWK